MFWLFYYKETADWYTFICLYWVNNIMYIAVGNKRCESHWSRKAPCFSCIPCYLMNLKEVPVWEWLLAVIKNEGKQKIELRDEKSSVCSGCGERQRLNSNKHLFYIEVSIQNWLFPVAFSFEQLFSSSNQYNVCVTHSVVSLCDPMDCSPPGSSVNGILQAKILEWVAIPFPRGSSQPKDRTQVSCIAGRFFTVWSIY